tara:strand:+ start:1994 stop:2404 length:411 start_codon:yes stop_codon:yes gene_type:complete
MVKDKEHYILYVLNNEFPEADIKEDKFVYNRYDAYNNRTIIEVKDRDTFYENTMIEFDKFSYNLLFAKTINKTFLYVVKMKNTIYMFNITKMHRLKYDFKWHWRKLPKSTEFDQSYDVKKFVGYVNIDSCSRRIEL